MYHLPPPPRPLLKEKDVDFGYDDDGNNNRKPVRMSVK